MKPTVNSKPDLKAPPAKKGTNAKRKSGWKKPKDKPKRPLSAYNLFFQYERDLMLRNIASPFGHSRTKHHSTLDRTPSVRKDKSKSARPPPHGKISFAELAKQIGSRWKSLDDENRAHFQGLAAIEKDRYNRQVEQWQRRKDAKEAGVELPEDDAGMPHAPPPPQQQHQETIYNTLNQAYEISSNFQMPLPGLPKVPTSIPMASNTYYIGAGPMASYNMPTGLHRPEYSNMSPVQSTAQTSSVNVNIQQHFWGQPKVTEPKMGSKNAARDFSVKNTLQETAPVEKPNTAGNRVKDADILNFLSRLVSD